MTRLFTLLAVALLAFGGTILSAGCNTVKGAGQDAQAVGENVEDAARDTGARR